MFGAIIIILLVGIIMCCIRLVASWNHVGIRFATPSAWVAITVAHVQIKATLARLEK